MRKHNLIQIYKLLLALGGILFLISPLNHEAAVSCSLITKSKDSDYALRIPYKQLNTQLMQNSVPEVIINGDPVHKPASQHTQKVVFQGAALHRSNHRDEECGL